MSELERYQEFEGDDSVWESVVIWRQKAVQLVKEMPEGQEREKAAYRYYKADQMAMNRGLFRRKWPEMEKFLSKGFPNEEYPDFG